MINFLAETYIVPNSVTLDRCYSMIGLKNNKSRDKEAYILNSQGLIGIDPSEDEFTEALSYAKENSRISKKECLAVAISKLRKLPLLTDAMQVYKFCIDKNVNCVLINKENRKYLLSL